MFLSTMIFFVNLYFTVSPHGTLSQLYNRHMWFIEQVESRDGLRDYLADFIK